MGKGISPRKEFEAHLLYQGRSNTANKQRIINVISAELKKVRCNVFNSHDDIDIVKLAVQSSLKCLTTVITKDKYLLVLLLILLYHTDVNLKPLYFKSSKKSNKMEIHNILHYKTILGSEIYIKLSFLHAFIGCDTTSSIYGVGKATVFKKLILNQHMQEVALVFTASSR